MKLAALLLAGALASAGVQSADPLKSPACSEALARLQSARASAAQAREVEATRNAAADACLGGSAVPPRPARVTRPPLAVPPPQVEVPRPPFPAAPPALPPPPVAIERAPGPALCDAGGCWSADGGHLRYRPPPGAAPGGPCLLQGTVVACP